MRHFTWAMTWIMVGLAVTLGTASVLAQIAAARHVALPTAPGGQQPVPLSGPGSTPTATRVKDEAGRSLMIAAHHHRSGDVAASSN